MNKQESSALTPAKDDPFMKMLLVRTYFFALVAVCALTIISAVVGAMDSALVGGGGMVLMVIMLLFIWKNHLLVPRIVGPMIALSAGVALTSINNGIHDGNILDFTLAIVLGGLFLGQLGIAIFGSLTLIAVSCIVSAELNGILVTPLSSYTTVEDGAIINIFFLLTCIICYTLVGNLNRNVERLRRSEAALSENNRVLEANRLGLEQQVMERTCNLETARQEVEVANQALQAQMWQMAGLAQLGDAMRGDQDPSMLARNVIRQLCQYLNAPIGALYVMESGALTLIGSYAYVHRKHLANQFALGQGLVGQVAREQRMITLSNVPDDYVTLRTGSGNIPLNHILAVPFLYNDEVIGVIELGLLNEFTSPQMHFLESAMSNIAIAFHTTQSRARIDALLTKTQEKQLLSQTVTRGDYVGKD